MFLPEIKEPGYFACAGRPAAPQNGPYDPDYNARITIDGGDCAQLYAAANGRLTGNVSPVHLVDQSVAARIVSVRPDARIIVLLRDPVERAFSQYLHHVRDGLEPNASFGTALEHEPARLREGWNWGHCHATPSQYAAQIDRYPGAFTREQILFLDFAYLNSVSADRWWQICAQVQIAHRPLERSDHGNVAAALANGSAQPAVTRAMRHAGLVQRLLKPLVPPALRKQIRSLLEGSGKPLPVLQQTTRRGLAAQFNPECA